MAIAQNHWRKARGTRYRGDGTHTQGRANPGRQVTRATNFLRWCRTFVCPHYETSCRRSGALHFEVTPTFLENLCTLNTRTQYTYI